MQGATQSALSSLLPAVLGGIAQKGATPQGATGLMSLINGATSTSARWQHRRAVRRWRHGVNALSGGHQQPGTGPVRRQGRRSVSALSSSSGIKTASATNLLAMIVPLVLTLLKKFMGDKGLNANSLSSLLSSQGPNLQGALDSRMSSALGFASPAAFLSGWEARRPIPPCVPVLPWPAAPPLRPPPPSRG